MYESTVEHDQWGEKITEVVAATDVFPFDVFEPVLKPASFGVPGRNIGDRQAHVAVAELSRLIEIVTAEAGERDIGSEVECEQDARGN